MVCASSMCSQIWRKRYFLQSKIACKSVKVPKKNNQSKIFRLYDRAMNTSMMDVIIFELALNDLRTLQK